ncbi:histidine kinase [Micromonospora sp. NPDC050686]|uniref:sensor histidine kinase n=1 Tax=Micromonospora sp. NPDC050686 TaxID=3154631 RepID=UPI0033EC5475
MRPRNWLGLTATASVVPLAVFAVRELGYVAGVPLSFAVCAAAVVLVGWPRVRGWVAWPVAAAAAGSLAATAAAVGSAYVGSVAAGLFGMLEVGALLILLALVVRWSPAPQAAAVGAVTSAAATAWILRFLPPASLFGTVAACALWALGPIGAAAVGGYLRFAALRLVRSVDTARRAQRLELAHDLHDFVAHDVTGMVVQAQAAQYAGATDPGRMLAALQRVEAAGLRALEALDQAVEMLQLDGDRNGCARSAIRRGLPDLPEVIDRFRSEFDGAELRLAALPEHVDDIPPPVTATAYRIVVEALTNVRRHARTAASIDVEVSAGRDRCLRVSVVNGGDTAAGSLPRARSSSGRGLASLDERVRALGGTFVAGPHGCGWAVRAELPATSPGRGGDPDG